MFYRTSYVLVSGCLVIHNYFTFDHFTDVYYNTDVVREICYDGVYGIGCDLGWIGWQPRYDDLRAVDSSAWFKPCASTIYSIIVYYSLGIKHC